MTKKNPDIETNDVGRPTKYKEEFVQTVYKLALLGATDKEMADILDIAESTFNEWKLKYPEFSESQKKGKLKADAEVAERLYKRATGYQYTEIQKVFDDKEKKKPSKITETRKTIAPDTTAQIFWLKNRRKKEWRDSSSIDHTSKGESIVETREERNKRISELIAKHNGSKS